MPKKRVGKITKATSYDMLISYYGARNIQEVTEEFGGYEEENPPTVLFQGTSKEIKIFWKVELSRPLGLAMSMSQGKHFTKSIFL